MIPFLLILVLLLPACEAIGIKHIPRMPVKVTYPAVTKEDLEARYKKARKRIGDIRNNEDIIRLLNDR